jgi:isoquinoline 1-oxidoreductase subunit alpha
LLTLVKSRRFLTSKLNGMKTFHLSINKKSYEIEAEPDMPLLWAIRDMAGLTGTKFGCGMGLCGACTIHIDGNPARACLTTMGSVKPEQQITTIEGISEKADHPVQKAWVELQVPQCGYCQSGQIMTAIALLKSKPNPTDEEIDQTMSGNICRCGTYKRIREAIHTAAKMSV